MTVEPKGSVTFDGWHSSLLKRGIVHDMPSTPPRGGPGSNQYQTKSGSGRSQDISRGGMPKALAIVVQNDAANEEDVAWVFDPMSDAWSEVGYGRDEAQNWRSEFKDPEDAERLWKAVRGNERRLVGWLATMQAMDRASGDHGASALSARAQTIIKYAEAGVDPSQVRVWAESPLWPPNQDAMNAGLSVADCVAIWQTAGFSEDEMRTWHNGRVHPRQAQRCRDACPEGLTDTERRVWRDAFYAHKGPVDEAVTAGNEAVRQIEDPYAKWRGKVVW